MRRLIGLAMAASSSLALALLLFMGQSAGAQFDGTTFTVNTSDDPASIGPIDGACLDGNGDCSLREAILEANSLPGLDIIDFDIPGAGPHIIMVGGPETSLPDIIDPALIDGTTQPGYAVGSPAVILNGSFLFQGEPGIVVSNTNNVTIQGLQIQDFPGAGISVVTFQLQATDITILGNTIDANVLNGIEVFGETSFRVGSMAPGDANIITRNGGHGVFVSLTEETVIEGNYIGTDASGAELGNVGAGIAVDDLSFHTAILSNSIAFNGGLGIDLEDNSLVDFGGEGLPSFPLLSAVTHPTTSAASVEGTLDAEAGTYLLQFFHNDVCDPSGFGEGAILVGSGEVMTDGLVPSFFALPLDVNLGSGHLTATSTLLDEGSVPIETSEFSACLPLDPMAAFTYDPNTPEGGFGAVGISVDFTDLSTDPDDALASWFWEFGDDTTSTVRHPSHAYTSPGEYTIFLTVLDAFGASDTTEMSISVFDPIEISLEGNCFERGFSSGFFASSSIVLDPRFEWDFGDGANATGSSVSHTWTTMGVYTVTVELYEDHVEWEGEPFVATTTFTVIIYASDFTEGFFIPGGTTGSFNVSDAFDLIFTGEGEGGFISGGATASPLPDCFFNEVPAIDPSDPSTPRVRAIRYLEADHFDSSDGLSMIEVRLYYHPPDASALRIPETSLSLWYWNGTHWVDTRSVPNGGTIPGATPAEDLVVFARGVNTAENYVWARVDHTSTFAVAGQPRTGGGGPPLPTEEPSTEEPPADDPTEETPPEDPPEGDDGTVTDPTTDTEDPTEILLTIYVNDQPITQPLNGVTGRIRIALEGDDDVGNRLRIYIVGQDGFEYYLGFADEIDEIDTGDFPNGLYTLEIRDYGDPRPGVFTTAQAYKVVRAENLLIQNALSAPPEAIAAVAVTVGLVGLGALLAQTFWTQFAQVLSEAGKESAISIGEDRLRKHRRKDGQIRRVITWLTFFGAVSLLGFFFTFEGVEADYGAGFIADFVPMLALIGIAAFAFFVGQFSLEVLANRVSGVSSRFRFLWPGAIALAISAVVFRTPFGYPGYVYESEMEEDRRVVRMKGVRALAVFAIMLTLLVPFIMIGYQWRWDFAQAGILVGLVALGTSTLPFAPLPGADVWRWRKTVSVAAIATSFSLFFGFQLALIPINLLMTLGTVGLPTYLLVLAWLHVRRLDPVPGWYARVSIRYEALERRLDSRTPASWKRFRAWRARAAQHATEIALRPVRSLAAYSARAVHRRRVRIAVPEEI